jgi:HD superfamily phosphohydrolase
MRKTLLFIFSFILQINTAYPEVYKWVDENGKTVYGDKPVSENADVVKIKKTSTQDKTYLERIEKQNKLLKVMQEERDEKIAKQKQELEKKEKQKEQCADMRKKLQKMKISTHLYEETDDPNNPKIYSNEERKTEEGKYEEYIKENC